jgi:hypothetical protein
MNLLRLQTLCPPSIAQSRFTLFKVEVLDEGATLALDPLLSTGAVLRLVAPLTEPATIRVDGAPAFTLTPTDSGQSASDPCLAVYEAIVAELGADDPGDTDDRWAAEGEAAMCDVLESLPASPVSAWRGEREVLRRTAEALGRSHGLSVAEIERVTGRAFASRKAPFAPMHHASRLAEQERLRAEETARAAAEKAAVEAERLRPKSLKELGLHGVEIRQRTDTGVPPLLEGQALAWRGDDGRSMFVTWRAIEALAPPVVDLGGVRVMGPEDTVPAYATPPPRIATTEIYRFILELRAAHSEVDRGPVTAFESSGLPLGREMISRQPEILSWAAPSEGWRRPHLCEVLVRALRIRVDLAAAMLWSAVEAKHAAEGEPWLGSRKIAREVLPIPPHAWQRAAIEAACVAAAMGGNVVPGELLSGEGIGSSPANRKHKKTSAARAE